MNDNEWNQAATIVPASNNMDESESSAEKGKKSRWLPKPRWVEDMPSMSVNFVDINPFDKMCHT